jgi:hypothetical protein
MQWMMTAMMPQKISSLITKKTPQSPQLPLALIQGSKGVEHLAEAGGHTILFTPAYHTDLQLIELVWVLVKGNVGRQYSNGTTLDMVDERLMHEFNQREDRGHRSNNGMIEKCASLAAQFHGEMDAEDAMDDDCDDAPENQFTDNQEDPPEPPAAACIDPGEQGGDDGSKQGEIGPFAMV